MCFPTTSLIAVPAAAALLRRWNHGPNRRLRTMDPRVGVEATVGQPLLTHRGWIAAGAVNEGDWLLAADPPLDGQLMSGVHCWDPVEQWSMWQARFPTIGRSCPAQSMWGDADCHPVEVCGDVQRLGPLGMSAGMTPPVDRRLVRQVLAAVTSAAVFGCSTWTRACDTVPGLTGMWPDGEPSARGAGLDAATRARLGNAVSSLPEPANTTEALSERLLGASAGLRLVRVEAAETRTAQGWHVNAASDHCTLVVGGVVAGTAP